MMEKFLTYEMFGAVGDGRTDDMPAIVRTHDEANRLSLPVKAKEGAVYYLSPKDLTAIVRTSADWTNAKFIIDDRDCENYQSPVFHVLPDKAPVPLEIKSLARGQLHLDNPFGENLHVVVKNANHRDYIRKGVNQNSGTARTDNFILYADGTISSGVAFDFEEVTEIIAQPMDAETLTLTGGEFTTIANQAESKYTYFARNIEISRSNVDVSGITHLVTGEMDHGAPYRGFISVTNCGKVTVHDCVFTGHFIYSTIGSAGRPVTMGTYDINMTCAAELSFINCTQTTDIMDKKYWGLIGSNFCRDLYLENCHFSRFDAHMGVTNCTLRGCTLGWQCLNAIGNGTFLVEDTHAYGYAFVNLRDDYGCTWNGDIIIRNSFWHPLAEYRAVFRGFNECDHDFGYTCYLPNVEIDGLTIDEETPDDAPLFIFNDYASRAQLPASEFRYQPVAPKTVRVRNISSSRPVRLCENPALMPETEFIAE